MSQNLRYPQLLIVWNMKAPPVGGAFTTLKLINLGHIPPPGQPAPGEAIWI